MECNFNIDKAISDLTSKREKILKQDKEYETIKKQIEDKRNEAETYYNQVKYTDNEKLLYDAIGKLQSYQMSISELTKKLKNLENNENKEKTNKKPIKITVNGKSSDKKISNEKPSNEKEKDDIKNIIDIQKERLSDLLFDGLFSSIHKNRNEDNDSLSDEEFEKELTELRIPCHDIRGDVPIYFSVH